MAPWRVIFSNWHPFSISTTEMPVQIQRSVAAVGAVVYCTPGYAAPITVYDAATGKVIKQHAGTTGTMEFVYDRGVLFAVRGDQAEIRKP